MTDLDTRTSTPRSDRDRRWAAPAAVAAPRRASPRTFDAAQPGTYTVTVDRPGAGDGQAVAVGPSVTGSLLRDLVPPAVILVIGLLAAVALTARRSGSSDPVQSTGAPGRPTG